MGINMSFRRYRLSESGGNRNAEMSHQSTSSRFIGLSNIDTSASETLLENYEKFDTIEQSSSTPHWWLVLPCLILIILVTAADPLLMNDLIIRRYEHHYGLDVNPSTQRKVCEQSMITPASSLMDSIASKNHSVYTTVQHEAARFHTKNSIVTLIPALVTFLFLGSNCDFIGRRPLLILPLVGKVVWYSLMLIIVSRNMSDAWLLTAHAIEAMFGSNGLVMLSAFAFIADCTRGSTRNRAFLVTEGIFFLTRIIPVLALGIWLRFYLYMVPLSVCLGLSIIALLYTLLIQPESVESVRNLSLIQQLARIRIKPLLRIITVFTDKRSSNKQHQFISITIALVLFHTMIFGYFSMLSLYLYGRPFCLDALHVSTLTSVRAVVTFLLSLIAARMKISFDKTYFWAIVGSLTVIVDLIMLSFVKTIWLLYIAVCIGSLFFITLPVLRTKLTRTIEPNEYAIAFVGVGVLEIFGQSAVRTAANAIYNASLSFFPGLIFLTLAIIGAIPVAIMCYLILLEKKSSKIMAETTLTDDDVVL